MQAPDNNSHSIRKAMLVAGLILATFTLIAAVMIAFTYQGTAGKIEQNKREFILKSLNDVFPIGNYDNDLIKDSYIVTDALLGKDASRIYPAFNNEQPIGAILTAVAPNGYNGKIKILLGVTYDGVIHAVRVVEHKETPGLGDPIEIKRSDWIRQFDNHSLIDPAIENWRVKKDGGNFDQLTGATVTPRAVVKAISQALLYYQNNRDSIYTQTDNKTD